MTGKRKMSGCFDFVADTQLWTYMNLDTEYVPTFGSVMVPHLFEPKAPDRDGLGYTLAISAPCARGKSWVFREYMKSVLDKSSTTRVLLLSANIMYGTNLTHEIRESGIDVGFYLECNDTSKAKQVNASTAAQLAQHRVVVCSFESLHHLESQRFDMILVDEIRHISQLPGGSTASYSLKNLFLLRDLWKSTHLRVISDADLLYKASDTEPCSAVQSFMDVIDDGPVLCARLTHRGPLHLQRNALPLRP